MRINLIVGNISQCICISNHHAVHLKYIQFSFVNYTSIKLGKKKKSISHHCVLGPKVILKNRKSLEYGMEVRGLEAVMAQRIQCF